MTQKNARKIGFFSALSICVGSMVGIGIFLKNASVGGAVQGDGISWLFAWLISGIIALLVAIHFGKIAKIELSANQSGLSGWTDYVVSNKNKWFKKVVSLNYGFFYNTILIIALSFFTTELFIDFLHQIDNSIKVDAWVYAIISTSLLFLLITVNYLSIKVSSKISIVTTILKFIPLIATVIIGISFFANHNLGGSNGFETQIDFVPAMKGVMLSIPSILFAFDSFVGVGALSKQVKGGDKMVSKVIVVSMISVTVIYLLICLASIFHFNGNGTTIANVLLDSLPKAAQKAITITVTFFVFVAGFGTTNAITSITMKEFVNITANNKFVGATKLKNKFGLNKASLILFIASCTFWSVTLMIPTMILNSDVIIDGFSNVVVAYFFLVYAFVIFNFWKNVWKKDEKIAGTDNKKLYTTLVFAAVVAVVIGIGSNVFFVIFDGIANPFKASSWGLLLTNWKIPNYQVLIIYAIGSLAFFLIPQLNFWLIENKVDKVKVYS